MSATLEERWSIDEELDRKFPKDLRKPGTPSREVPPRPVKE